MTELALVLMNITILVGKLKKGEEKKHVIWGGKDVIEFEIGTPIFETLFTKVSEFLYFWFVTA